MNNNDVLRQIRYIFDFNDDRMMKLFKIGGYEASRAEVSAWLKQEDLDDSVEMIDFHLAAFLNGFIIYKRGKKEGAQPLPEQTLDNNIIFRKIKIALNLKVEEIVEMMNIVGMVVSKHEINAFFRKPSQNQYRKCLDQYLRNFLFAMKKHYRDFKN